MIDFNTEPYNDDFDENNKFYRILFRPGFAVQARELTQLQTILQNQIKRHGDHMFKQGAMIIPGQISLDNKIQFVKLKPIYSGNVVETYISKLEGQVIVGESGLEATVIKVVSSTGEEPTTLYIRYTNSGDDFITKSFGEEEVLTPKDPLFAVYAVQVASLAEQTSGFKGTGSIASIERGVYYVNGHFVLCEAQTIVLDKYSSNPSYRVGLNVVESLITPEDPGYEMLLDNAQNSYNYAAPGAHRYYIDLVLTKLAVTDTADDNFIELLRTNEGKTEKQVSVTDYAQFEKTLARRTYDESGNYTVVPFKIDVREHRNNNRGNWVRNTSYLIGDVVTNGGKTYVAKNSGTSVTTNPVHTTGTAYDGPGATGIEWEYNEFPWYNRGIYTPEQGGSADKLAVGLEPGKAYVQGFEIEKIATEYVEVDKCRGESHTVNVDNAVIPATVGNYVVVSSMVGIPPSDKFGTVDIYDKMFTNAGTIPTGAVKIGTARVRGLEWHNGTIGSVTAQYKLFLFDIKLTNGKDFNRNVKSFYYRDSTNQYLTFSANIQPYNIRLNGNITASGTTVTGNGTSFQTDLVVGDYIATPTGIARVETITGQQSLTIEGTLGAATNSAFSLAYTEISEPDSLSLIFPFPYYAIKTVRGTTGTNDTTYSVVERFTANISNTSLITLNITNGTFASAADSDNYLLLNNATGAAMPISTANINVSGSTVTFNMASLITAGAATIGDSVVVYTTINKSGTSLTEKTKDLVRATVTFDTQDAASKAELLLGKADGYRLISAKMDGAGFRTLQAGQSYSYTVDILDRFDFDNGQRQTHYDQARLVLKSSYTAPAGPVQVVFEYFTHSAGDYFTVNSYPSTVAYELIPYFNGLPLRDVVDFRPRINDAGTGFTGTGASMSMLPKRGVDVRADFQYHLARKTKIAIDFNGKFFAIDGVPSLAPGAPLDPALGMVLYNLTLEPYTFSTSVASVNIEKLDNKRYTMRDIGALEKRIDNLEYYTSLSLLEQQTESLDVIDSNGDSRLKNGFIVDGFSGHNTGNVTSPDYMCSIDMENQELRPFFSQQNINLVEKLSNNTDRAAANYKVWGDVITLPIIGERELIKQEYASRLENINPFAVFTFLGDVSINPSSDDWFEVDRKPDIVNNVEGNFNTIQNLAAKAGILGTVWNAWQTQWSGVSIKAPRQYLNAGDNWAFDRAKAQGYTTISVAEMIERFGGGRSAPARQVIVETDAQRIGQSRTGVTTSVIAKIDRQVVNDRVLSTAVIPYIRSRNVLVQITGLKPNTQFYPFFDDVKVQEYCTQASKILYTPLNGAFDTTSNVGGLSTEVARRINGDTQICLNRGDVITGQTSGATAVVIGYEYNPDANEYRLQVANVIGTFIANETFVGSITGARGRFSSIDSKSTGGSLVTNFQGEIQLLFNIPNNDSVRFRTGNREFKMVDVDSATLPFTSRARGNYRAEGVLETRQATVNAVRNGEINKEPAADNRVLIQYRDRVVDDTGWYDPLAQTFLVQNKGGAFLTKIDVFFASKDPTTSVTLELREVVNGYPGKTVLPFSRVTLLPSQVNLSSETVEYDGALYPKYNTPTTFTFPSPVYVQDNAEYAIVLASDSNNYKVWVSQIGDQIPGSTRTISEQPYTGVLFKSQNASTWTADQLQDLKFTIYRAQFDTSKTANVEFVNDVIPLQTLEADPFECRTGYNKIRVWQRDHGMAANSRVTLSGVTENILGIPMAQLNTTHQISDVDLDSYCITVATAPTASGYAGGYEVKGTRNYQYDQVFPSVQLQTFSETYAAFGLRGASGKSVDGIEIPYVPETVFTPVLANENNRFQSPKVVASELNEQNSSLSGARSLTFTATLNSTNDSLSPVIDTHRTSMTLINNKINSPSEVNVNIGGLDDRIIFNGLTTMQFQDDHIICADANTRGALSAFFPGKYIRIEGSANGNNGSFLVKRVEEYADSTVLYVDHTFNAEAAGNGITAFQKELFVDEIAPMNSSSYSKYVTNKVNLALPAKMLRVRYACNLPAEAAVEIYYKTSSEDTSIPFDLIPYTKIASDSPIVYSQNGTDTFIDFTHSAEDIPAFNSVQVKIVMKSTNSSAVPRIKDLRILACA